MADIQILCVERQPNLASYSAITRLSGQGGAFSKNEVVEAIKQQAHNYFIVVDGHQSQLGLWQQGGGTHLRSHAHGVWNDDLLKLPPCLQ